ncbi:MAG: purine-nucleoside phosphorylase [Planctomycetota bacterium]
MPQAAARDFVRSRSDLVPDVAIILGSGLGGIADEIESPVEIDFSEIPGFVSSTAGGHRGQLILGHLEGRPVVTMAGRFHRYEGHNRQTIVFPIAVMQSLGAHTLFVSNAAGGINPRYSVGDLVVIDEHIDWIGGGPAPHSRPPSTTPLREQPIRLGRVHDPQLGDLAIDVGLREGFVVRRGTYLATTGPTYETRAEYRMMRRLGADLAGMSTIPESVAAAELGMRVLAISMVSNVANPDTAVGANHADVLRAGESAAAKMVPIVRAIVSHAGADPRPD